MKIASVVHVPPDRIPTRDITFLDGFDILVLHNSWADNIPIIVNWMKSRGKRVVVSTDDLIIGHLIPENISSRAAYLDPHTTRNIHDILEMADRIVTTTPFLSNSLSKFYQIPISKFHEYPNLPSINWLGRWMSSNRRPKSSGRWRVGVTSSLSHYAQKDGQKDDFQIIVDAAKALHGTKIEDRIQWVLPVNGDERTIARLSEFTKNIESVPQTPIRDYPAALHKWDLDFSVAPLLKNDFNDSKSNIKMVEAAAMGYPLLASRSCAYDGWVGERMMFDDAEGLAKLLSDVTTWSNEKYADVVKANYSSMFARELDYYGQTIRGFWLEANIDATRRAWMDFSPKTVDGIVPPSVKEDVTE